MPSAGIKVDDAIMKKYQEVKTRSGSLDYITLKLNKKGTKIVLNEWFPKEEEDIKEFKADKKNDTREENFLTRVWPKFVAEMKKPVKGKPLPQYAVVLVLRAR